MERQLPLTFEQVASLSVDQIWLKADAELLKMVKEDRRVERKPAGIQGNFLAEYFSMFSNTAIEGGLIAVGVENKGQISGCAQTPVSKLNKLESQAHQCCPDAIVHTKRLDVVRDSDGQPDFVLLFRVHYHQTKVVHTTSAEAFIRRGEDKNKLTAHEVRDLQNDKGEVRVEQELFPSYEYPTHFHRPTLDRFFAAIRSTIREPHTDEELLCQRKLGAMKAGKFIPSAACVLLFAMDPGFKFPGCKVRFLRFDGVDEGNGDEWNAVRDSIITGPIPVLLEQTERALNEQLRTFSRLGQDNRFYTAPEYPAPVWYEALVNACVHRSYGTMKNVPIFVKMFDNRIEVLSPGPFPPAVTPETIYGTHSPRNPNLMDALWVIDVVKCAAEGTKRMRRLMSESGLPAPEFMQQTQGSATVLVTLRNNIQQRRAWIDSTVAAGIDPEVGATLSDDERRVINHLAEHGTVNTSQAMRLTGKGWKSAHRMLLKLQERKVLKYHHRKDIERDPDAFFALVRGAAGTKHDS